MKFFILISLLFTSLAHASLENFYFQVDGDCKTPATMAFHKNITGQTQTIGKTPEGHPIMIWINLSLFRNKTYYAEYIEYTAIPQPDGKYQLKILFGTPHKGNWEETNYGTGQINILNEKGEPLFFAVPSMFTINGKKSLQFMIPPEFAREQSRNKFVLLYRAKESVAAYGEKAEEYCKAPY